MLFPEKDTLYDLSHNRLALYRQSFREENFPTIPLGEEMSVGRFAENLMLVGYTHSNDDFVEINLNWAEGLPKGTRITWKKDEDKIQPFANSPQIRERQDLIL